MSGADLFPYPDDTPGEISSARTAFRSRATSLSTLATKVGSDGDMTNHGWDGRGSIGCGTEIRANKPLLSDAGTAMGDIDTALKPYQQAVTDARTDIKKLRGNYDTAEAAFNKRLEAIDNDTTTTQAEKDIARGREADGWRYTAQGFAYEYQGYIEDVDTAAGTAATKLGNIGTKINGHDLGGKGSDIDLAAAVMPSLPFLSDELGEEYAQQAATLIRDAANGDNAALEKLKEYSALTGNPEFSTQLMYELGPDGLLELPGDMAKQLSDLAADDDDLGGAQERNAWVLTFLSSTLATASNDENDTHLSDSWLEDLQEQGRATHLADDENEDGAYDGYWGLGQILAASDGHPPYSPHFMDTVGDDMIDWDREHDIAGQYGHEGDGTSDFLSTKFGPYFSATGLASSSWITAPGTVDDGETLPTSDPLVGLMHAATYSHEASQELFDYPDHLKYLMDRSDVWPDNGEVFGNALETAAVGDDAESRAIAANAVHYFADDVRNDYSINDDGRLEADGETYLTGIRDNMGRIVASHIEPINSAMLESQSYDVNDPGVFGAKDLAYVLVDTGRDDGAHEAIMQAQLGYMRHDLHDAATGEGPIQTRIDDLEQRAGEDAKVLGMILEGRSQGLEAAGREIDAQNDMIADYVNDGLGLIPIPGGPVADYAAGELGGWLTDNLRSDAVQGAYSEAANYELANRSLMHQIIETEITQNGLWLDGHQPPAEYDDPATGDSVQLTENGQLIPLSEMTEEQQRAFQDWSHESISVPQAETTSDGANNDGQADLKTLLELED